MSKQKEYELIVEIRYIVKAKDVHDAIEKWNRGDFGIGDITTEKILDATEIV